MKLAFIAASVVLLGMQARAGAVLFELDPEIRAKTMQILAKRNVNYREQAKERLKGKGHFDRQRVESTGMLSADDTRRLAPADFDDYIKPSVKADKDRTIGDWVRSWGGRDYRRDMKEMKSAMRGEMTERAKETVSAYKDMEINEIIAHSWGSQLIYAAILNGEIRPPKKLIVVGVPDDDHAKWSMLAARTGTEVFWGRADNDAAAKDKGVKIANEAARDVDFEAKWDAACADKKKRICHPHGRRPQSVVVIPIGNLPNRPPLPLGHDRADYYDTLRAKGFFKGTAQQLEVADNERVVKEATKLEQDGMAAAHEEARRLIEMARAQAKIAEREHDERLKRTYADLAIRSCANPGSVTQAELDRLPVPYEENLQMSGGSLPHGLRDHCTIMVYHSLKRGVDAESIRQSSMPAVPARQPPPGPQPARVQATVPFDSIFPRLKDIAVKACASPAAASLGTEVLRPSLPFSFSKNWDDERAALISAGLGDCPRKLFNQLIETIRSGKVSDVNDLWLRDQAARFTTPVYVSPPPRSSPPTGCIPGDNSRRNCIACGNKNCG